MSALRRALMVVFQFPPFAGSSAVQRALRFVQHLPDFGWQPLVLTADPRAYEQVSSDLTTELPPDLQIARPFALDAKRHLSIRGRHPGFLARPDRWRVWQWTACRAGRRLIAQLAPDVIWSTYPIVSAHEIAYKLARSSGLPWVADFRDPMVEENFPESPSLRADLARREAAYAQQAKCFTVTTPSMRDWFLSRYPSLGPSGVELIENGYDEASFVGQPNFQVAPRPGGLTLLHSGELYPEIRDPCRLFAALKRLQDRGVMSASQVRFRFRGAGDDAIVLRGARAYQLENAVEVAPRIPYKSAIEEMSTADGLVILQGADCNRQIPAKVYEYMRTGRPILGITDPQGDTGRTLLAAGCDCVAALEDQAAIEVALERFLNNLHQGVISGASMASIAAASRTSRTRELAALFDRIASGGR